MDWTLIEALLVGAIMSLMLVVGSGAYYLGDFIMRTIKEHSELKKIRPIKTEYIDYDQAWEEMVMKD